jgi:hypothetical protein
MTLGLHIADDLRQVDDGNRGFTDLAVHGVSLLPFISSF